jgi:hypothetical protein
LVAEAHAPTVDGAGCMYPFGKQFRHYSKGDSRRNEIALLLHWPRQDCCKSANDVDETDPTH